MSCTDSVGRTALHLAAGAGNKADLLQLIRRTETDATMKLGPPVVPFYPFLGEGSSTQIDYRQKGTLILTSLLEQKETARGEHFFHKPPIADQGFVSPFPEVEAGVSTGHGPNYYEGQGFPAHFPVAVFLNLKISLF